MSMKQAASRVCSKKPPAASRRFRDAAYAKCHGARKSSWHFCLGRAARRPVQDAGILPHVGRRGFSVMCGFAGCSCRMFPGAAGCSCCMPPGGLQDASAACFSEGVCGKPLAACSWKPQSAPVSCPQERVVERPCRMPPGGSQDVLATRPRVEGCPCCILRGSARRRARRVESCVQTHSQRLGFRGFLPRGWLRARGLCRRTASCFGKKRPVRSKNRHYTTDWPPPCSADARRPGIIQKAHCPRSEKRAFSRRFRGISRKKRPEARWFVGDGGFRHGMRAKTTE